MKAWEKYPKNQELSDGKVNEWNLRNLFEIRNCLLADEKLFKYAISKRNKTDLFLR